MRVVRSANNVRMLTSSKAALPNLKDIRAQFPALASEVAYFDNAGGSQLPRCVIEAVTKYMETSYAQLGGGYEPSVRAAANVKAAHELVKVFLNVPEGGSVILGPSTTALCHLVANAYADAGTGGGRNQIIVATAGHEANVGPWARLAARGFEVTLWPTEMHADGQWRPSMETLAKLVSKRTRLVAMPQVSNILGEVWDVAQATRIAHGAGARMIVDGVAYAPHAAPDMKRIGCDWYVYSTYKVFGPHMAALGGTAEAFGELTGPNHFFIPRETLPNKFELGGCSHEGCAAINALSEYAAFLAGAEAGEAGGVGETPSRELFERAFARVSELESGLLTRLLEYLASKPRVRVVGPASGAAGRVCTVAFVHATRRSSEIATRANEQGLGIRFGHFYSKRLIDELTPEFGLLPDQGVVRVSLQHYNSGEELERLFRYFDVALG
ncbi:MAG: aminotransferase class V-fold PLP-dependent enzyme [Tepidisphaera sp.]|nr:aminotransferase class V-fold PLP-dependent enzyme [Tepidisphaera sp.]